MKNLLRGFILLVLVSIGYTYIGMLYFQGKSNSSKSNPKIDADIIRSLNESQVSQYNFLKRNETDDIYDDLSQEEVKGLFKLKENQRLTLDMNLELHNKWKSKIFKNVADEKLKQSMDITLLLAIYDLTDYSGSKMFGVFQKGSMQDLHNYLLKKGSSTIENALSVGAEMEELILKDLYYQLDSVVTHEDIKTDYQQFKRESEKDLVDFVQLLENYNITYQPAHLSFSIYEEIVGIKQESVSIINL